MLPNWKASTLRIWFLASVSLIAAPLSKAGIFDAVSGSEKLTAVSSSAHNGYVRVRLADGSFKPETFAIGDGGALDSGFNREFGTADPTIDNVGFPEIAQMLAEPLASQKYVSTRDPNDTKLLVMVFWGRTIGGNHTTDGNLKDMMNFQNARLLGFDSEGSIQAMSDASTVFFGRSFRANMLDNVHADVLSAIEVDRYYVILRAYDFQAAWKQKKLRMLWETRFSLSERRHDFERDLPGMAQNASLYFGQDSYGLVLKPIPEGHVHVGEATPIDDKAEDGNTFDPQSGIVGDWQRTSAGPPLIIHIDATGKSTFESLHQHAAVSALVTTNADDVTMKVPGWGILINGTLKGNRISGSIVQYDKRNSLTLTRIVSPAGDAQGDAK
jgi:hypothetical protein